MIKSIMSGRFYSDFFEYAKIEIGEDTIQTKLTGWLASLNAKRNEEYREEFTTNWKERGWKFARENLEQQMWGYYLIRAEDKERFYAEWGCAEVEAERSLWKVGDRVFVKNPTCAYSTLNARSIRELIKDNELFERACVHYHYGALPEKNESVIIHSYKETEIRTIFYVENEKKQGFFVEKAGLTYE